MRSSRKPNLKFSAPLNTPIGGGGPVSLVFKSGGEFNLQTKMGLQIDYSKAATPDLAYVTDYVNVVAAQNQYTLVFGKTASGEQALRTMIEIVFSKTMFQSQLLGSSREFIASIEDGSPENLSSVRSFADPDKVQTFRANNVFLGTWGDDSVADFYYLSPGDFVFVAQNKLTDIRLVPVVRVTMDARTMVEFLRRCHIFDEGSLEGDDENGSSSTGEDSK